MHLAFRVERAPLSPGDPELRRGSAEYFSLVEKFRVGEAEYVQISPDVTGSSPFGACCFFCNFSCQTRKVNRRGKRGKCMFRQNKTGEKLLPPFEKGGAKTSISLRRKSRGCCKNIFCQSFFAGALDIQARNGLKASPRRGCGLFFKKAPAKSPVKRKTPSKTELFNFARECHFG